MERVLDVRRRFRRFGARSASQRHPARPFAHCNAVCGIDRGVVARSVKGNRSRLVDFCARPRLGAFARSSRSPPSVESAVSVDNPRSVPGSLLLASPRGLPTDTGTIRAFWRCLLVRVSARIAPTLHRPLRLPGFCCFGERRERSGWVVRCLVGRFLASLLRRGRGLGTRCFAHPRSPSSPAGVGWKPQAA